MSKNESGYDYANALGRLRDARCKRGVRPTKKLIEAVSKVNRSIPPFNEAVVMVQPHSATPDDTYSTLLLKDRGPADVARERVAKLVRGNGNCLFNSASVALTGKFKSSTLTS